MTHKFRFIGLPFYLLDDFGRHTSNDRLARSHVIPKLLYSHIANNTLLVTFHPLLQVILRSAVQQFTFFPVNICFQFYIRCKSTNNILNSYYIYSWFIYPFRKKSIMSLFLVHIGLYEFFSKLQTKKRHPKMPPSEFNQ